MITSFRGWLFFAGLILIPVTGVRAADEIQRAVDGVTLEQAGRFPEFGRPAGLDVAISGEHAFITSGGEGLLVVDVSDPVAPEIEAAHHEFSGRGRQVEIEGALAFVTGLDEITAVDIADPDAPRFGESIPAHTTTGGTPFGLKGTVAYFVRGRDLAVFDFSDIDTPQEMRVIEPRHEDARFTSFQVFGDLGVANEFIPRSQSRAFLFDLSDPKAPVETGVVDVGLVWLVEGDLLYHRDFSDLVVLDISDPANPTEVGRIELRDRRAQDLIRTEEGFAHRWAGRGTSTLDLYEFTSPTTAELRRTHQLPDTTRELALHDGLLYAVGDEELLNVYDVRDGAPVESIGSLVFSGETVAVEVAGEIVYLADSDAGLRILDVSSPGEIVELARLREEIHDVEELLLEGDILVAALDGIFSLIDVANPSAPRVLSIMEEDTTSHARDGAFVYGVKRNGELLVFDISNPLMPETIARVQTDGRPTALAVGNGFLYVVDSGSELVVYDVHDPSVPKKVGTFPTERPYLSGVEIEGSFLLATFDLGDEESYTELLRLDPVGGLQSQMRVTACCGFDLDGHHLAVADNYDGVVGTTLIDVKVPDQPVVIGSHVLGNAVDVVQDGDRVFVAHGRLGLSVLEKRPFVASLGAPFADEVRGPGRWLLPAKVPPNNGVTLEASVDLQNWQAINSIHSGHDGSVQAVASWPVFGEDAPQTFFRLRSGIRVEFSSESLFAEE